MLSSRVQNIIQIQDEPEFIGAYLFLYQAALVMQSVSLCQKQTSTLTKRSLKLPYTCSWKTPSKTICFPEVHRWSSTFILKTDRALSTTTKSLARTRVGSQMGLKNISDRYLLSDPIERVIADATDFFEVCPLLDYCKRLIC
jgi:hypothetical protein